MPKIEPFAKHSDAYDEWFKKNIDLYEAELEIIRRFIPQSGAKGLEVGIGSGKLAVPLGMKIGVEPSVLSSQEVLKHLQKAGIEIERIRQTLIA